MRGTCGCTKWKVALHWMCCLTFSKLSVFRNALLLREIHILAADLTAARTFCYYCLIKVYFVPDQFSVNGFFLIGLFVCCFQSLANLFPEEGEIDLKIFPRGWGFWYDLIRAFVKSPYVPRVWGGGGFNWLVHNTAQREKDESCTSKRRKKTRQLVWDKSFFQLCKFSANLVLSSGVL